MKKIKTLIRKYYYLFIGLRAYFTDLTRNINANYSSYDLTEDQLLSIIIVNYHVVEKGLTMPNFRLGFGYEKVLRLINYCLLFIRKKYNTSNIHYIHAIKVVNEYYEVHLSLNHQLPPDLLISIERLRKTSNIYEQSTQIQCSISQFFNDKYFNFGDFAKARHSVRNFEKRNIPIDEIIKAVTIAINSPSSCNRQPIRVYIIKDEEIKQWALDLQGGNRGFGNLINKVIVLTINISYFTSFSERNEPYINAGMFAMTLIYALQDLKIGTVPLAYTNFNSQKEKLLRGKLNIPNNEALGLFIGCGYVPEKFFVASSPKNEVANIINII